MSTKQGLAMKPSQAFQRNRDAVRALVARYPAANPRIFGSVLHGDDREGSDIDILIDALPGATLFNLGGLQMALQDLLGVDVDLVLSTELPVQIRDQVLSEASAI